MPDNVLCTCSCHEGQPLHMLGIPCNWCGEFHGDAPDKEPESLKDGFSYWNGYLENKFYDVKETEDGRIYHCHAHMKLGKLLSVDDTRKEFEWRGPKKLNVLIRISENQTVYDK